MIIYEQHLSTNLQNNTRMIAALLEIIEKRLGVLEEVWSEGGKFDGVLAHRFVKTGVLYKCGYFCGYILWRYELWAGEGVACRVVDEVRHVLHFAA